MNGTHIILFYCNKLVQQKKAKRVKIERRGINKEKLHLIIIFKLEVSRRALCISNHGWLECFGQLWPRGLGPPILQPVLDHAMAVRHLSGFWLVALMESRVPTEMPSLRPMLYHFDLASHTASRTLARSPVVSFPVNDYWRSNYVMKSHNYYLPIFMAVCEGDAPGSSVEGPWLLEIDSPIKQIMPIIILHHKNFSIQRYHNLHAKNYYTTRK